MSRVDVEQVVRSELGTGERLLWAGQPRQGIRMRPTDAFVIPFSLLWGGFAIYWESTLLQMKSPDVFALWGIPFVVIGLYMIVGRLFVDARLRSRTYYGLSDRRVVIVSGLFSRTVKSLELRNLPSITLREGRSGNGTITFGNANPWGTGYSGMPWPGMADRLPPSFDLLENVRQVYNQVRSAQTAVLPAFT